MGEIKKYIVWCIVAVMLGLFVSLFILRPIFQRDMMSNAGFYNKQMNVMSIKITDMTLQDIKHTLNHELGHYLYFECLNKEYIKQWKIIHKNLSRGCILDDRGADEDFAESYACYMEDCFKDRCKMKVRYFNSLKNIQFECD